jgi:hypothetical protein
MIISWWDYGWPLWYYLGHDNTMTDNGYHGKYDSYAVGRILLSDSQSFTANAALYFSAKQKEAKENDILYALEYLAKQGEDLNQTFAKLKMGTPSYKRYGDVYILIHSDLLSRLNSIDRSSGFDLTTGKYSRGKTIKNDILLKPYSANKPSVIEGGFYTLDAVNGTVTIKGNTSYEIKRIGVSKKHQLLAEKSFANNALLSALIAKDIHAIYLDNALYDSFFIQAYFFDNYDKKRFKKVVETPFMKIFKVLPQSKN